MLGAVLLVAAASSGTAWAQSAAAPAARPFACADALCGAGGHLRGIDLGDLRPAARPAQQFKRTGGGQPAPSMSLRDHAETFDCPVSFAFGGELGAKGSKAAKVLGQTTTWP